MKNKGGFVALCVASALLLAMFLFIIGRGIPAPQTIKVSFPENAEVYPSSQVQPGTFRVIVTPEKLLAKAKQTNSKILATFEPYLPQNRISESDAIAVKYWLERSNGTFYYAESLFDDVKWPTGWATSFAMQRVAGGIKVYPEYSSFFTLVFPLTFFSCLATLAWSSTLIYNRVARRRK